MRTFILSLCLFWLPPNQDERVRLARDFFYHTVRHVLLCHDALWPQKRRSYIPAVYASRIRGPYQVERRGICGQVRSRSLLLPPLALGSGLRMQGRQRRQWRRRQSGQVSPNNPPFPLLSIKTGGFAAAARIHRIECVRFCCRRQLGPTTAESHTCALGNNYSAVADGYSATVALFHPSAAAHASLPTRGSR